MSRIIVVSDLHVDTWDSVKYGEGAKHKTKLEHWRDFLGWCAAADVEEFILNGDLFDAPPYRGNESFTCAVAREAVELFLEYAASHKVTYIFGNHDIGVSGVRCCRENAPKPMGTMNLVYPTYILPIESGTILAQHGHLYDVELFQELYEHDLTKRTYDIVDRFQWIQQRRDPDTGAKQPPGIGSPQAECAERTDPIPRGTSAGGVVADAAESVKQAFDARYGLFVKHRHWRKGANELCEDYRRRKPKSKLPLYCFMGHTHIPDLAEVGEQGQLGFYLNSGSWCSEGYTESDRQSAYYLDVDLSGQRPVNEWIRHWIWAPSER